MRALARFTSFNPARRRIAVDYIFDIETEDWDTFVCGGVYQVADGDFVAFWDEDEMVDFMLRLEGACWGHNAGRYDTLWLAGKLRELIRDGVIRKKDVEIRAAGSRVLLLRIGKLHARDSAALIPIALKDAAGIGGTYKAGTGLRCTRKGPCKRKPCGGYCAIRRKGMSAKQKNALLKYLEQDCVALAKTLLSLQDYADENDLDLAATVGASAWKTAKRVHSLDEEVLPPSQYRFARKAYFGGRTQVFRPVAADGYHYDVNSAYPAALMSTPLPVGHASETAGDGARRAYERERPGVYRVTVHVPNMFVPPLPVRGETGNIAYPTGTLTGEWSRIELAYAVSLGCEVLKWGNALVWPRAELLLAPNARRIWALRDAVGKKSSLGKWLKFYANSLTGKLAQSPEQETFFYSDAEPKRCAADGDCDGGRRCESGDWQYCCPHRCVKWCGAWAPAGAMSSGVWKKSSWRIPDNGFVQWALYLTSVARVALHKQLVADGFNGRHAVYCDTDSCFTLAQRFTNVGAELGQWSDEGPFTGFHALAPKTYRFLDAEGKETIAAKGISEPSWDDLAGHREIEMNRGVYTWKTALKEEKLFRRKKLKRSLKFDGVHFGDRMLRGELTYPPEMP